MSGPLEAQEDKHKSSICFPLSLENPSCCKMFHSVPQLLLTQSVGSCSTGSGWSETG